MSDAVLRFVGFERILFEYVDDGFFIR